MKGNVAEGYSHLSAEQQQLVRQALWSVYEAKIVDAIMKTVVFAKLKLRLNEEQDLKKLFIDDTTNDLGLMDQVLAFLQDDEIIQSNIDLLAKALALETQTVIACEQEETQRGETAESIPYNARHLADLLNAMITAIKKNFPDIMDNIQMRRMFFLAEMKQDHEVVETKTTHREGDMN